MEEYVKKKEEVDKVSEEEKQRDFYGRIKNPDFSFKEFKEIVSRDSSDIE